jgi:hypothetical protein
MLYDKFELTKFKLSFKFMSITELFKTVVKARITRQSHFTVKPAHRHIKYTDHSSRSCLCRSADFSTRPCTKCQPCRYWHYAALCSHHIAYCTYCWPWNFDIVMWGGGVRTHERVYLYTWVGNRSSNKCSFHVKRYKIAGFIHREMTVMLMLMVCSWMDWKDKWR